MSQSDEPQVVEEKPSFTDKFPIFKNRIVLIGILFVVAVILLSPIIFFISSAINENNKKPEEAFKPTAPVIPDQLVVQYKDSYSKEEALELKNKLDSLGVVSQEKVFNSDSERLKNFYLLKFKKGTDIQAVKKELESFSGIESADVQYKVVPQVVPNDPLYPSMWAPSIMGMPAAWDLAQGSKSVVVAVIDSGVDYTHPDLAANVIRGPNLAVNSGRSIDDPGDDFGHGTHVAGTIGAVGNNGVGVTGNAWSIGVMGIKIGDSKGGSNTRIIAQGIAYAADHGAKVINISMGSDGTAPCDTLTQNAVNQANSKGALVVVAAGNSNADASRYTPAGCSGVLVVGATDASDRRAGFSNYGAKVDIAAPGVSILSTLPPGSQINAQCNDANFGTANDGYGACSGTSMASPQVAGIAGLIYSLKPSLSGEDVKKCILENADPITTDKPIGGKRINAVRALSACSGITTSVSPSPTPIGSTASPTPSVTVAPGMTVNVVYDINNNRAANDSTDLPYVGANVSITGSVSKTGVTDSKGVFVAADLPNGQYEVNITIPRMTFNPLTTVMNGAPQLVTAFVPTLLLTPLPTGITTPSPVIGSPIQTVPAPTVKKKPTPTPAKAYTCHMKGNGLQSEGAIIIGDLVCDEIKK